VDTGPTLATVSFPVRSGMSVQLNYYLTCRAASRILPDCLESLVRGSANPVPQLVGQGAYYRWPDSLAFDRLKARGHSVSSLRDLWGILSGRHG
jgi:hypothetical protein